MAKKLKVEILNQLCSGMSSYAATQWLKKPLDEFDGESASEILKEGDPDKVEALSTLVREKVIKKLNE